MIILPNFDIYNDLYADRTKDCNNLVGYLLLSVYAIMILIRCPSLLEGRFWAEEGKIYFAHAYGTPWYRVLFTPHLGYYSFVNVIGSLLASRLVPLEQAPRVTILIAFLVQVIPAILIIFSPDQPFRSYARQTVALMLILVTVPSQEIWLHTAGSQFYLALSTGIILVSNIENKSICWLQRLILLISGLTGPVAIFLTPLFWLVAYYKQSPERAIQASILTFGALIQVALLIPELHTGERGMTFNPIIFLSVVFIKDFILPITNISWAETIARYLILILSNNYLCFIFLVGFLFFIYVFFRTIWRSGVFEARVLAAASIITLILSYFGALDSNRLPLVSGLIGGRYFFVPNAFLGLSILSALAPNGRLKNRARKIFSIILIWLIIAGGLHYSSTSLTPFYFKGPQWSKEVEKWKKNTEYEPAIWPDYRDYWRMKLSDHIG